MKKYDALHAKAAAALKEAVKEVVENHRRTGRPLAVWRKGKVVWLSAEEALKASK